MRLWCRLVIAVLCVGAWSCRQDAVRGLQGEIQLTPAVVDFGTLVIGQQRTQSLEIINGSRATYTTSWSFDGGGVFAAELPQRLVPGMTSVEFTASPVNDGVREETVSLTIDDVMIGTVTLRVDGFTRVCRPSRECVVSTLDLSTGECVESNAADDSQCGGNACTAAGACFKGKCLGAAVSCDDDNPCTTDSCDVSSGCLHVARVCAAHDSCHEASCVPDAGCVQTERPDGVPCSENRGCTSADVCVAGACVQRDPPEGFLCAEASPCQGPGHCHDDVCERPAATALQILDVFPAEQIDGGPSVGDWNEIMITPANEVTFGGYLGSAALVNVTSAAPVSIGQGSRRCIHWSHRLVCADLPGGAVSAFDVTTGGLVWSYTNVLNDAPELAGPGHSTFLARVFELATDRVGVIFETMLAQPPSELANCRTFTIVVLDSNGQRVASRVIRDPIFTVCNHPHSYGVGTDRDGNIVIAFSPSTQTNPATPQELVGGGSPAPPVYTRLMAFRKDGSPRWAVTEDNIAGGEIAIANGALYHHESKHIRSMETGETIGTLPTRFGDGVVAPRGAIVSNGASLSHVSADGGVWWSIPFAQYSSALRLATWATSTGQVPVVTMLEPDAASARLVALSVATGNLVFSCRVPAPADVSQFEVGHGLIVSMHNTKPVFSETTCSRCDPQFAQTRSDAFVSEVPTLSFGQGPWVTRHGDAKHSHHESQ